MKSTKKERYLSIPDSIEPLNHRTMKIYFCHSKEFDYKKELYEPLRASSVNEQCEIFFPHESDEVVNSKEKIKECDAVFAEVTHSAVGMGIELGWAEMMGRRIVCFYRKGAHISRSLGFITKELVEYDGTEDLVRKVGERIKN